MPQRELWTKEDSLGDKFFYILRNHWNLGDDTVKKIPESLALVPKEEIKDENNN